MPGQTPHRPVVRDDLPPDQRIWLRKFRTWKRFHRGPRQLEKPLTARLADYPDAVLVAGCQRSGTTMLTRVIARSQAFRGLALTHDDELDAAIALAGYLDLPRGTRYCFQTTYLNERYPEYRTLGAGQKLIWVLRNPASVVYSMVYNWKRFALNELYRATRAAAAKREPGIDPPGLFGLLPPARSQKAVAAYVGKSAQILEIAHWIGPDRLLVLDYDELVKAPREWLPRVFSFIGEPYDPAYGAMVRGDSVNKAKRMSTKLRSAIEQLAMPTYQECLRYRSSLQAAA